MSLRDQARAELGAWTPTEPAQEALRQDYLALLDTHADALWRSCAPAHLTAGAFVLDPTGEHTLLVLHGKINAWVQPGGHCETADESLAAAALREVREETGVAGAYELVGPTGLPEPLLLSRHLAPCGEGRMHYDVQHLVLAPSDAEPVVSAESHDVRWFGVSDLPAELAGGVAAGVALAAEAVRTTTSRRARSASR